METDAVTTPETKTAAKWIKEADCILICAGAGMSVSEGYNPYGSKEDFFKFYPGMKAYGYNTSYECMGLFLDRHVPTTVKWGYQAEHIYNMRYKYPPHHGYNTLLELCKGKDYFVVTSNVDGYFERSGFDKDRIYTPQGDWKFLQCMEPCSREVYDSLPIIEKILPSIKNCEITDPSQIPHCPKCGGTLFGNVRGGDWYIHDHYTPAQNRLIAWVTQLQAQGKRLAVLEIGAGWNTPIVTRWPMEAIVRDTPHASLVRVNPAHPGCPNDIPAVGLPYGSEVLTTLKNLGETLPGVVLEEAEKRVEGEREKNKNVWDQKQHPKINWRAVLQQLRE